MRRTVLVDTRSAVAASAMVIKSGTDNGRPRTARAEPAVQCGAEPERCWIAEVERFDGPERNVARGLRTAYLKKHGIPDAPQDLTKHACIRFRLPSGALVPWRFGKKRRTFEVHVEGPLIASEPGIAITAAIDGAGLCSCRLRMLPQSLPRVGS